MKLKKKKAVIIAGAVLTLFVLGTATAAAQTLAELSPSTSDFSDQEVRTEFDDETLNALMEVANISGLDADEASKYTLGATDVIQITVMRHPEVTGEYMINSEGKIQYAFVGDVKIKGLTKEEVSKVVEERLKEYIISPEVTITITGYNSKIVYVVGEVFRPGKIFMRGDTITVREALMQAGLPMLSGITKKSKLITPSKDGKAVKKNINVYALLYEGDLRENDTMLPGDVLYIPPTFLTRTMRAIQPITAPIGTVAGTGRTLTTGF